MRGSIQEKEVKKLYNNVWISHWLLILTFFLTISLSLIHSFTHSLSMVRSPIKISACSEFCVQGLRNYEKFFMCLLLMNSKEKKIKLRLTLLNISDYIFNNYLKIFNINLLILYCFWCIALLVCMQEYKNYFILK